MTTDQLKSIFENDYNREDWRNALQEIFHIKNLYAIPSSVELGANDFDAKAVELGSFETAEGLQVGLYEVAISPDKRLDRNKVGLRNLMRKVYQNDGDAALIVFTQGPTWRFTYASELTIVNKETGERERRQTDPKRYTYVLGINRHCRTAVERFSGLKATTDLFNENKISIEEIEKAFSVETLTKQFYKELFDWYQWALSDNDGFAVTYPNDTSIASDDRKIDEHIIRLITRLMFVWFIKQKNLVPDQIFKIDYLKSILKKFDPCSKTKGNYYNAILQNFFFATLNKPIDERAFAEDGDYDNRRKHYGIKTYFRNPKGESWFKISNEDVINIFSKVPFLNGGLFECLDKSADSYGKIIYHDGFSREERVKGKLTRAFIPNCLFFDAEKGLIPLLEKYNFTIEESTPIDVEVALDPELLGKIFENLLGAFNPETKETARKQSGSFYTPREIVNYMVDESLIAYLQTKCPEIKEIQTRSLFIPDNEIFEFTENERYTLTSALKSVKILDPACGSGAFPMGVLNKMVELLRKLEDEESITPYEQKLHLIKNCIYGIDIQTIAVQISKLRFFISLVSDQTTNSNPADNYGITPLPNLETKFVAANTLIGLEKEFTDRLDLGFTEIRDLKDQLWKIRSQHFSARNAKEKNNLREADEKLRKKIQSLLVDLTSKPDTEKIKRLELEINALKVEKELYHGENVVEIVEPSIKQGVLFDNLSPIEQLTITIDKNKEERKRIDKLIKEKQKDIDKEQSKTTHSGFEKEAVQLAKWDPYDQNTSSHFFDTEWMFDVKQGFDVVIGNPPYGIVKSTNTEKEILRKYQLYRTADFKINLFALFLEKSILLSKSGSSNSFIIPDSSLNLPAFKKLREYILTNMSLKYISHFNEDVFKTAAVGKSVILQYEKKTTCQTFLFRSFKSINNCVENEIDIERIKKDADLKFVYKSNHSEEDALLNKLKNIETKLNTFCEVFDGINPGSEEIKDTLITKRKIDKNSKKIIDGKCFTRYSSIDWDGSYIYYNEDFVEKLRRKIEAKGDSFTARIIKRKNFFIHQKIITRQTADSIIGTLDSDKFYVKNSVHSTLLRDDYKSKGNLKIILAILNSSLINWYYKTESLESGRLFPQVKIERLRNLPILLPLKAELKAEIENIVDTLLFSLDPKLIQNLDNLIYKHYGLTYDEVKSINPEFWLSEEEYEKVIIE